MHSIDSLRYSSRSTWLTLARTLQIAMICVTVGLFIASVPHNYTVRSVLCEAEPCPPDQFAFKTEDALARIGMTVGSFARITVGLDILLATVFSACALVIFIRKPRDPFTVFVTVMLVTFGMATFAGGIRVISYTYPKLNIPIRTIEIFGNVAMLAFLFVFPNGRFTPRWTVAIVILWFLLVFPPYFFPDSPLNLQSKGLIFTFIFYGTLLSGIASQIYRHMRVSDPIEKQQTKWVVYGMTIGMGGYVAVRTIGGFVPDLWGSALPIGITLHIAGNLLILLLPLSISIAVIRYRLWDINPIINRTLVYGALSFLTIAFYVLTVGGFAFYFHNNETNIVIAFIATGIVAILFEPLRQRLQRAVNRLMYGERDDPATVLMRLSQRLDSALAPASVLQTIVETLAQTLRLPYSAISLLDEEPRFTAGRNLPPSELIHLPLTYQTERVGDLILAPRAAGESFSPADMKLINIIAQQAGVAAYTVRLNNDLQKSRERLITAQEEERRRLRRDLHDGVGPTLASFSQRLDTAADLVNTNPPASIEVLKDLKAQVKIAVAEIRRLVYALRPPVLDEFGLVTAIREHVAPYTGPNGIQITFDITEPLPSLPAAVEVAAYRIALEAFTNIVNHAHASACYLRLCIENNSLLLAISDNGKGLDANHHAGVGLTSMRERAAELGGEFVIENNPLGGTTVRANLPITNTLESASILAKFQEEVAGLQKKENE